MRLLRTLFLFILTGIICRAVPQNADQSPGVRTTFKVEDGSGAPLENELVIVKNLDDHARELLRGLTDRNGDVPALDLQPGLYRVIAAYPYGEIWETQIREFLAVAGRPRQIVLTVSPMPTHGYGDVIPTPGPKISLQVVDADGRAMQGAIVLVRDKDATLYLERSYETDAKGKAKIELVGAPLDGATVVVVAYKDILVTREVTKNTRSVVIHLPSPEAM